MKKLYILLLLTFFSARFSEAQTVILNENFTTYDSSSGPNYHGWFLTFYGATTFYTSNPAPAGSAGPSGPNTYKFGKDSCYAITPMFTGADSVHFFMKVILQIMDPLLRVHFMFMKDLIQSTGH